MRIGDLNEAEGTEKPLLPDEPELLPATPESVIVCSSSTNPAAASTSAFSETARPATVF